MKLMLGKSREERNNDSETEEVNKNSKKDNRLIREERSDVAIP